MLIDHGVIHEDALRRELITRAELEGAAHKQGFASLDEIDCAILEPGGAISFFARKPSVDSLRHDALLARMDQLSAQVVALRS